MKFKTALALAAFAAPLFVPITARADSTNCSTSIHSMTNGESRGTHALVANDYITAYSALQTALEYREECVRVTSGLAKQWNTYFVAVDFDGLAAAAGNTETYKDQFHGLLDKAHSTAGSLLRETLPDDLHNLTQTLEDNTEPQGLTVHSQPHPDTALKPVNVTA